MTTNNIKILSAENIFQDNPVFTLHPKLETQLPLNQCSGVACLHTSESRDFSLEVLLDCLLEKASNNEEGYTFWLLSGQSAWQPDNRIIRARKFWGTLKSQNIFLAEGSSKYETLIVKNGKLKFFGAISATELKLESLVDLFKNYRTCTYLLMVPKAECPNELLNKGWGASYSFDEELLKFALLNQGALIKSVGEFDDAVTGLIALGSSKTTQFIKSMVHRE